MIAVETNVLVHAHRRDSQHHVAAGQQMKQLIEDRRVWAIPWPCIHEFYGVVTNRKLFNLPSTPAQAFEQIRMWTNSSNVMMLAETEEHLSHFEQLVRTGDVTGGRVHDARIAAICLEHGVTELWTADRDFRRFPALRTWNPLREGSTVHDQRPSYAAAVRARAEGRRRGRARAAPPGPARSER